MSTSFKRPESVLVVIYTVDGDVLLMERQQPRGFWQSVTGSLHWDEDPVEAAVREVAEETGLAVRDQLIDCNCQNRFEILPAWRASYGDDVSTNLEHVFRVELPERVPVEINPDEHVSAEWVPAKMAALQASSHTNQTAIERFVLYR